MVKEIRLPQLGQTMEEGTIVTAMVKKGDKVNKGDVIFEVETDKATLEMESPAEGFVKKILIDVGSTVPVNTPILILADESEEISQEFIDSLTGSAAPQPELAAPAAAEPATVETKAAAAVTSQTGRIFASPRAKAVAAALGVDLAAVSPAQGAQRIVEADVRKAAASGTTPAVSQSAYKPGRKIPVSRIQKLVGQRMLQSKQQIPCFYLSINADVTDLVSLRQKLNKASASAPQGDEAVKVSYNDFIIRAVAIGLRAFPVMTGQLAGDFIQLAENINIGLAISVDDGLVAPVVKDADKKNAAQIAEYSKALIARAKGSKLSPDDLEGGCITVSNLGGFGIDAFIAIVVPGQCSILGIGRIADTCLPIDGNIIVRKIINLTLSVDHKVANGAEAAQFLDTVKKMLEHPENLTG